MQEITVRTKIPRRKGETFYARPTAGGPEILVKVVNVALQGDGCYLLTCKEV
jgi:hypothetical protein